MYKVCPGQRTNGSGLADYGGVISIAWGTMCSKRETITYIFGV